MAQGVFRIADIEGLTPAIDPTRSQKQFVLNGRNYIFDAIGPKSAFGNRWLLPHKIESPTHVQGIRLKLRSGDRCFTITNQAIMEWREDIGGWRIIYVIPNTADAPYRWTFGYLSGAMYFCHPRTGIIAYVLDSDIATSLLNVPGAPQDALAVCVDNGRIVAITPEYTMWSDPSNGLGWVPALGGAGFQQLAARVSGYPVMINSYDRGVLVWTTGGVLRGEFTGDKEVYRWRALNTEYRPINSFCTFKADDTTVVLLDERGLFASKGEAPVPFAPMFNEFLIDYLQRNNLVLGQNVRLEWDELKRLLFLSISESRYSAVYEECFVLYPPNDKWGQFNEPHYGILPFRINTGERIDDYYGFVDTDGRARLWQETGSREVPGSHPTANLHYPVTQKPFHYEEGEDSLILSSSMIFNTVTTAEVGVVAGLYPDDGQVRVTPSLIGLDAYVHLGLFRNSSDGMGYDELVEIHMILLRSNLSGEETRTGANFNLLPPEQPAMNYNLTGIDTNFGTVEDINYVNSSVKVIGTNDGVTEFYSETAEVVGFSKAARHYSCSVSAIWHIIEVRASDLGEAFHVRTLELTGSPAGRLL